MQGQVVPDSMRVTRLSSTRPTPCKLLKLFKFCPTPPARSEQRYHRHGRDEFDDRAEEQSDPGAHADVHSALHAVSGAQFAGHRAKKRPEQQTGQTKEKTDQGAQQGAPYRSRARTDALGAECPREQVYRESNGTDEGYAHQPPHTEMVVMVHTRDEPDSPENQRDARQHRHERTGQSDHDQQGADDVKQGIDLHGRVHSTLVRLRGGTTNHVTTTNAANTV